MAANLASSLQLVGLPYIFLGDYLYSALGQPVPHMLQSLKENKMIAFGGLWMVNTVAQNLIRTGAFEVYFNEQQVHSRLESGTMPSSEVLSKALLRDFGAPVRLAGTSEATNP